ncbi:lysozyme M1 precursor [mine drainage metagenome]|uniref:Lysozyme M1 n=1 Tax=mine drainage metagenome TaxID=410659 RepID=A0A1J5QV65_9ZZZZ
MLTRRTLLAGLVGLASLPLAAPAWARASARHRQPVPLDGVIDISHMTESVNFEKARRHSRLIGVIHKASEGGDWRDPLYARRRAEAEAAGLLWGAYHFGTREYSGHRQAELFLHTARPGHHTLLALDFEYNDQDPANSMRLHQAEDFVRTVVAATGRHPMIYTNQAWADGQAMGEGRHHQHLHHGVPSDSILAQCPLWLADYRTHPQVPRAWRGKGWAFWQYAGDTEDGGPRHRRVRGISGINRCDRNLFHGDLAALRRFWHSMVG